MIEAFAFSIAGLAFASRRSNDNLGPAALPGISMALIAGLGIVQLVPLSTSTLQRVSLTSAHIYAQANEILKLHHHAPAQPRISIAPVDTERTILLTLSYAALFMSSAILSRSRQRRRAVIAVLFATSVPHVLFAASRGATDRIHGAFVNANNFAGYLEIALAFAFGIVWTEVITGKDRRRSTPDRAEHLEQRIVAFAWRVLLWAVIATGIALTRSRGGVAAALVSTMVLAVMGLGRRRGERTAALMLAPALALGITFVVFTTGRSAVLRFVASDPHEVTSDVRLMIWTSTIKAWRLFPTFGDGLGAFKEAFRRVQPAAIPEMVEQAHNDFLQLLVTGGWIGGALGLVVFGSLCGILLRAWLHQKHREERAFLLAAFGALLSLMLHGMVEFNMSLPAIPATLAIMTGAAMSANDYH